MEVEPKVRHGRRDERMLWALYDPALNRYVDSSGEHGVAWPQLGQLLRMERRRTPMRRGQPSGATQVEVTYYVTSAMPQRADARHLLHTIRVHWCIENRTHRVRDWNWDEDEDRCQVRSGAAPEVLATARNVAMAVLRSWGADNLAAALRTLASHPAQAVALLLDAGSK